MQGKKVTQIRLKVCFKCHEYVPLLEDTYINKEKLEKFDLIHSGHPVQIVNEEELENKKEWKLFL